MSEIVVVITGATGPSGGIYNAEMSAVAEALDAGRAATIIVQGDSTGNESDEWVRLVADDLAAKYSTAHVRYKLWSDATQDYGAWSTLQAGGGERGAAFAGSATSRSFYLSKAAVTSVTGDIDIRARLSLSDWSNGANQTVVCRYGASGAHTFAFRLSSTGRLVLLHSADGSTDITKTSTTSVSFSDGEEGWIRVTLDVDNGASGNTATFYTSTDGATWTELGTAQTAASTTSLYDHASQEYEIGAQALTGGVITGTIYEVQIRDGIDGPVVNPQSIEAWYGRPASGAYSAGSFTGGSTLYVVNGSHNGATSSYLSDATRFPKMVPPTPGAVLFVSCAHNDNTLSDAEFITARDAWQTLIDARLVGSQTVHLTQNPTISPVEQQNIDGQARRRLRLMSWAARKGVGVIDTFKAFTDNTPATLIDSDGVHPNVTGSQLWADTIMAVYNSTSINFAPIGSITASHESETTNVHGIVDTSTLVTTSSAPELIRDTMGAALVAGSNVTITVADGADTITIAASGGGGGGALDDLTDVTITAAASGDILRHNGTAWVDAVGTTHFEVAGAAATAQAAAEATASAALSAHTGDTVDAHDASAISFVAGGTIAGTDVQTAVAEVATDAASALSTHAALTSSVHGISAFGATLVDDASASAARTTLGLVIGTDVQAQDTELAAIAGLTSAADSAPYFTGSGTAALMTVTSAARTVLDDASVSAMRTTLDVPSNAEAILDTLIDAKGDIITATGADTPARLAVGTDGHVLTADSAQATGIKWAAASGGSGVPTPALIDSSTHASIPGAVFTAGSTMTWGKDNLWMQPVYIPATITVSAMQIRTTVAGDASSLCRLGIYATTGALGGGGARVIDAGTVALDGGTGLKTLTGLSQSLTAGWYYLVLVHNSTGNPTFVYRGYSSGLVGTFWKDSNDAGLDYANNASTAYAALAATAPTPTFTYGATTGSRAFIALRWT